MKNAIDRYAGGAQILAALAFCLAAQVTSAAGMPDGPGKQVTVAVCGKCHSPDRVTALHQDRKGWESTISKMVSMGAEGTDEELTAVLNYLSKSFPPPPPHPVNINTATNVELESSLLLLKSEAASLIRYRSEHGDFKSLDDLRKVPKLNFEKVEQKKSRISFAG